MEKGSLVLGQRWEGNRGAETDFNYWQTGYPILGRSYHPCILCYLRPSYKDSHLALHFYARYPLGLFCQLHTRNAILV